MWSAICKRYGIDDAYHIWTEASYHLCCMWGSWHCPCDPSEFEGACLPSHHKPTWDDTTCKHTHTATYDCMIAPRLCFQQLLSRCLHLDEKQCHRYYEIHVHVSVHTCTYTFDIVQYALKHKCLQVFIFADAPFLCNMYMFWVVTIP